MIYIPKTFNLPALEGISAEQIRVHLALYEGYVKHVNLILEKLAAGRSGEIELDPYLAAELRRRLGFEFDGMRMHEYYFAQFEGGSTALTASGPLAQMSHEKYGDQGLETHIKEVAGTRGVGWVVVYYDAVANTVHTAFVADHEIGQLAGLPIILALDMWEHAYMVDYVPADKKNYVDAFFANLNWGVIEERFDQATPAKAP